MKSKITLLSSDSAIDKRFYPYRLKDNPPKWFKNMEHKIDIESEKMSPAQPDANTYKVCPALMESFKRIIVIPSWTDINIKIDNERWHSYASQTTDNPFGNVNTTEGHGNIQHKGYRQNQHNIKFISPWSMSVENASTMVWFTHPHFHDEHRFEAVTGIVDMAVQCMTNINTFWLKHQGEYTIRAGEPLVYLIPLVEDFEFDVQIKDTKEIDQRTSHLMYSLDRSKEYWKRKAEMKYE